MNLLHVHEKALFFFSHVDIKKQMVGDLNDYLSY